MQKRNGTRINVGGTKVKSESSVEFWPLWGFGANADRGDVRCFDIIKFRVDASTLLVIMGIVKSVPRSEEVSA